MQGISNVDVSLSPVIPLISSLPVVPIIPFKIVLVCWIFLMPQHVCKNAIFQEVTADSAYVDSQCQGLPNPHAAVVLAV